MTGIIFTVLLASKMAAFEYRESSPSSLFPYRVAVSDYTLPDSISNPSCLTKTRTAYLCFSACRPYELAGLYSGNLKAGLGSESAACRITWDRFGIDQYMENILEGDAALSPSKYISMSCGITYYNLCIRTPELKLNTSQADLKTSLLFSPIKWIDIGFIQDNAISLFIKKRRDLLYPSWSSGVAARPIRGLTLAWNINKNPFGYSNSLSMSVNILECMSLSAGYSPEINCYSGSVSFTYSHFSASYGIKYHPQLGVTHSVGFTLSAEKLLNESVSYMGDSRTSFHPSRKIDINNCSPEELRQIPVLESLHAERLIKYRKIFGPVSRISLNQIGMGEREINDLMEYCYGLVQVPLKEETGRLNPNIKRASEKKKALFILLVREGVSASAAIRLSEIFETYGAGSYRSAVDSLLDLEPEKRKRIRNLCPEEH
ncbi:MAG: helix-hairpin-helix domain-containing protein [Spirochaetes bacterium]|jgi:hypothetical protein|nr:helix-hairpin-helix domain-containing protein [Spirochaetota bacterium]